MTALRISVVISAYTEARWSRLISAVASVKAQTYPAREIIVVVDHNPSLLERVRGQISKVVVIENAERRGLSGARNSGITAAQGDVVAFLDDDAIAAVDWIASLAEKYDDPRVVGAGGSIEPLWESKRPAWFPEEFDWVVGCTYRGMPQQEGEVRNLIGCNMSFRHEIFAQAGGFRTEFGRIGTGTSSCEETEFCIRVHQNDPAHSLSFAPRALVFHHVPSDRARWGYFQSRCLIEGMAKARLSHLRGARDGLSSERAYVFSALPRGILRGLADVVRHGDLYGLARAGAIIAGFSLTTAGYLSGMLTPRRAPVIRTREDANSSEHQNPMLQAAAPINPVNGT